MARMGVIMAVRDGAPFVGEAVESVLAQDFRDWELVVVDDGSTDETPGVLEAFKDPRIRVVRTEGAGRAAARNRALEILETPWIAVLDGDDRMSSDRLGRQWAFLEARPEVDVLVTPVVLVDRFGRAVGRLAPPPTHEAILRALEEENCLVHPSSVLRAGVLREAGGYRESFPYAQDYDLWLRLAERGAKFAVLEDFLTFYRVHEASASEGHREIQAAYAALARACRRARLMGVPEPRPTSREELLSLARRDWSFHLAMGRRLSRKGSWGKGLVHAVRALRLGGWQSGRAWRFLPLALLPPSARALFRRILQKQKKENLPFQALPAAGKSPGEENHEHEETDQADLSRLSRPDPPAAVVR